VDQITVNAPKWDAHTLEHVLIPHFVRSHSVPTAAIGQITRWRSIICPSVTGLQSGYGEQVERRIVATARSVGAQTAAAGHKCAVNIEIVFTPNPQAVLTDIAAHHPALLGSARAPHDTTFSRSVQSWYVTGTHSVYGWQPPVRGLNSGSAAPEAPSEIPPAAGRAEVVPDAPYGGVTAHGMAGSHLGRGLASELLHALVIVDARKLQGLPLGAMADYVTMVALTRMTVLNTCNELPSVIDLLSEGCSERARPAGLTPADSAFLKALYASELDMNLNIEEGELHDRMMAIFSKAQ
jgi:hypothetical protein